LGKKEGLLGFDRLSDMKNAILQHNDFATRWEVSPALMSTGNKLRNLHRKTFRNNQAVV